MKTFILLHALLVALCSHLVFATAINRSALKTRQYSNDTLSTTDRDFVGSLLSSGNIVNTELEDGRQKIDFFGEDGILEITAIETEDGAIFYDNEGNEVNLADLDLDDEDNDRALGKRVAMWRLAIRFARLIAKYGKKVWPFIRCVGTAPFWKCGDKFLRCAEMGRAPWSCPSGGFCIGKELYQHCK